MLGRLFVTPGIIAACLLMTGSALGGYISPFVWEPVTDADWAITADSARGIHEAAMIFERVHVDDGELRRFTERELKRYRSYRSIYRRVRILNTAGRKWGDVDVPIFHDEQKIESIQGRTILRDGTVILLQPDQIHEKEVIKTDDEKYKQTSFSLPGVTDDCIVEYIIVCKAPYSSIEWLVQKNIPLLKFSYQWKLAEIEMTQEFLDFYRSSPILDFTTPNYLWINSKARQTITPLPDKEKPKELLFEAKNLPPFEEEPHPMPDNCLKDQLLCYYGNDASPARYWGAWSNAFGAVAKEFCTKNERLREKIKAFDSLADNTAKIKAAYAWIIENITNLSYLDLHDKKDPNKKVEPKPISSADDVIKLGYGFRDDIDLLFWGMLRAMNIDAKYVYAKDRFGSLFVEKAKYPQFDRSAVGVKQAPFGYKFYTPGLYLTPDNMVPWYLEGVTAIMADADEYLVTIPFSPAATTHVTSRADYEFTDDMGLIGRLRLELTGQEARTCRIGLYDEDSTEHFEILKNGIDDTYPQAEFDSIDYEHADSIYQPFILSLKAKFPSVTPMSGRILFKPCDYLADAANKFIKTERTGPVLFRYAETLEETADFRMPNGWRVEALPGDSAYSNKVGRCEVKFTPSDSGFTVSRSFTLTGPFWLTDDYSWVRRLYQARREMSSRVVVLSQKTFE
jgi:transglutaminase-like putative cysteine protease